jgi:hypothetical protein
MDRHDEQFENFLREFEPCRPRALPDAVHVEAPVWTRRLAAAAVLTVAAGASLWFLGRNSPRGQTAEVIATEQVTAPLAPAARKISSAWALTRLALEDPARLDASLDASGGSHLPRFDREDSVLRILAKE